MNKIIVVYMLTLLALILSACNGANSTETTSAAQSDSTTGTLPVATQLLLGTLKLEGTDLAVTKEQAAELLPLWQVYSGLLTSDTAAQAEIDALIEQIQDTMTAGQMQAIENMKLTGNDMFALMQEQGVDLGAGPSASGGSSSSPAGMPSGGDPGAGGPPADMGAGDPSLGGQALSPDQITTARASSQTQTGDASQIPSGLIEALIELLQGKIAS